MWAGAILAKVNDRGQMTSLPSLVRVTTWTATILVEVKRGTLPPFLVRVTVWISIILVEVKRDASLPSLARVAKWTGSTKETTGL